MFPLRGHKLAGVLANAQSAVHYKRVQIKHMQKNYTFNSPSTERGIIDLLENQTSYSLNSQNTLYITGQMF